jgi:DNA-binding response OmpR family regulator
MPPQPSARPCVLCIDDDEDFRVMLVTRLRHELIEARAVATAAEAISSTQTERFDLYVVDAQLTDLDGFDLCRRIRDVDPDTPILFFSGAADEADRKRGIAAGANDYVIKPDLEGLLGSIKRFISGADGAQAKVIPFERKVNSSSDFTFEPAA